MKKQNMNTSFARLISPAAALLLAVGVPTAALLAGSVPSGTLTVRAAFLRGTESVLVQGTAPAGTVVLLGVSATFNRDLPSVVVDRADALAGTDGRFRAVLPYTPASEAFTVLSVQASADGMTPVTACCFPVKGPQTSSKPPKPAP